MRLAYYRALAAVRHLRCGNLEQAISDLVSVRNQDKNNLKCRMLLARVYERSGRYGEAAGEYADVLKLNPESIQLRRDYAELLMNLAEVQQQLSPSSKGDLAFSIQSIRPAETLLERSGCAESAAKYPQQAEWPMMLARVLSLSRSEIPRAQQIYEAIYKELPDEPVVANAYAESLLQTKNYEDVIKIATGMMAKRPELLDFYLRRAAAYVALHKDAQAQADIDHCFAASVEEARRIKNYTAFFEMLNASLSFMPPEAVGARLEARLKADPNETVSGIGLVQTLVQENRPGDAVPVIMALHCAFPRMTSALKLLLLKRKSSLVNYRVRELSGGLQRFFNRCGPGP